MSSAQEQKTDWSATQYLKFGTERTRPVHDLLSPVLSYLPAASSSTSSPLKVYDLGCGPGNSTAVLSSAIPGASFIGMDSSPDMLSKAGAAGIPNASFVEGDLGTFTPDSDADLVFSNAAFHWLRSSTRLPTLVRLLQGLKSGGILAFQIPDNYHAPSHTLMRTTAQEPSSSWAPYFSTSNIGNLSNTTRPDLDPIESQHDIYNALVPYSSTINTWRTEYMHVVAGPRAVVEWVKSTGLKPFLDVISDEGVKTQFLERYEANIKKAYPEMDDGNVLLGYPRLFVVAVRK
jgi:trans-aconitate 2-methyltransferase